MHLLAQLENSLSNLYINIRVYIYTFSGERQRLLDNSLLVQFTWCIVPKSQERTWLKEPTSALIASQTATSIPLSPLLSLCLSLSFSLWFHLYKMLTKLNKRLSRYILYLSINLSISDNSFEAFARIPSLFFPNYNFLLFLFKISFFYFVWAVHLLHRRRDMKLMVIKNYLPFWNS